MSDPKRVRPDITPDGPLRMAWKRFTKDGDAVALNRAVAVEELRNLEWFGKRQVPDVPDLSQDERVELQRTPREWSAYLQLCASAVSCASDNHDSLVRLEQLAVFLLHIEPSEEECGRVRAFASSNYGLGVLESWARNEQAHREDRCASACASCFWNIPKQPAVDVESARWTDEVPF